MARRTLTTLAAVALACALAAPSLAATVTSDDTSLVYTAAAGEKNDLDVHREPDHYLFTESGAPLSVDLGCTQLDANSASCPPLLSRFEILLGDLGDRARVATHGIPSIYGGPGRDDLWADSFGGLTRVYGEGGDDIVSASGEGGQIADGGSGNDVVHAGGWCCSGSGFGGPGDDVIDFFVASSIGGFASLDGGPGRDVITVQAGRGGTAAGGEGPDVLTVDSKLQFAFIISGIELRGGAGNDRITGGPYDDTIDGGDGIDIIDVRAGGADGVSCGGGRDTVRHDANDTIAADCEVAVPGT